MSSVRPSGPSVTLVDQDHIYGQLAQHLRSSQTKGHPPTPGEHREILGRLEVGWEKVACWWSTKAAISLKRVKIEDKLLWMVYRNSPKLFRTVPSPTPYGLPFPRLGAHNPTPKLQSLLSQERLKLRTANLADTFIGSIRPPINSRTGKATNFKFGR